MHLEKVEDPNFVGGYLINLNAQFCSSFFTFSNNNRNNNNNNNNNNERGKNKISTALRKIDTKLNFKGR